MTIFGPQKWHFWWQNQNFKTIFIVQTFPKYCRNGFYFIKISSAWFWPNFNFVDFRAYFGHFSHVKRAKNKIAKGQQKECSNQKIEENKSGLEFNFLWKSKCASLNFEIWVFEANLTEPYCTRSINSMVSTQRGHTFIIHWWIFIARVGRCSFEIILIFPCCLNEPEQEPAKKGWAGNSSSANSTNWIWTTWVKWAALSAAG